MVTKQIGMKWTTPDLREPFRTGTTSLVTCTWDLIALISWRSHDCVANRTNI